MRIMFASGQGGGHFGPLVPFARAASAPGHEVARRRTGLGARMVQRAGFAFHAWESRCDRAATWAPVFTATPPAPCMSSRSCSSASTRAPRCPQCSRWSTRWRPDLIVRETCEFASCVAAEHFDVPLVDVGTASRRGDRRRRRAARDRRAGARAARPAPPRRAGHHALPARRGDRRHPLPAPRARSASTVARLRLLRLGDPLAGAVPLHRARARRHPEARADDDRPPRRPRRARPAPGERPRRALGRPGRGHAARGGDGRPWRLGRDAGGARRRRPARASCRCSSTARPTRPGSPRSAPGSSPTDSAAAVHELLDDPRYRAAAERVAAEIRALPPVEDAVEVFSRSA